MARFNRNNDPNYFRRRQQAEEEQGQRTVNIQQRTVERLGAPTNLLSESNGGYNPFGAGYEAIVAPTTNDAFPRARVLGYNRATQTLVVIFRDRSMIMYDAPVPPEMWEDLKYSDSTGKYLKYSGIDDLPWTKVPGPGSLPRKPMEGMQYGIDETR